MDDAVTQAPVVIAGQDIERQIATATPTNCLTTQRRLLLRGSSEVGLRCILLAPFEVSDRLRSVSDSAWIIARYENLHERRIRWIPQRLSHSTKKRLRWSWLWRQSRAKRKRICSGPLEISTERFNSSVARLSSNSIEGLHGLVSELQEMQEFLEVGDRTACSAKIDSALAGINIIVETIGPWKSLAGSQTLPPGARNVRAGGSAFEQRIRVGMKRR